MSDETLDRRAPRRFWPWLILAGVILGILLFAVWVWFAAQGVKRIKASTEGLSSLFCPTLPPARAQQFGNDLAGGWA